MDAFEFEKKKVYSDGNGVAAFLEENIGVELNEFGLYEEKIIDENQIITDELKKVLPYLNDQYNKKEFTSTLFSSIKNIKYNESLGYYNGLYVGNVIEGSYREEASSGGFGTWIFKELLENNYIDGVLHVKESKNQDILFDYGVSKTIEEIKEGAKTRYYPVELSKVLEFVKDNPGKYAVIGIPTFIATLRLLVENDIYFRENLVYFIGLVCGHQKSTKFGELMAWQAGIKPGNPYKINFREKLLNSPANKYGITVYSDELEKGFKTIPTSKLYGQNWGYGFFKSVSSDFTDDVFNETADVTLGDAWLPQYTQDSLGNNILIVRNEVIKSLLVKAREEGRISLNDESESTIFNSQSSHYNHTHDELSYREFLKEKKGEWYPNSEVLASKKIPYLRKKVQETRQLLAHQSHISYQKAVEKNDIEVFYNEMDPLIRKYEKIYRLIRLQKRGITKTLKQRFHR
ncbi:Coenzyme F420 hydrogenase/dehydrogenase, beta subunit C-terminal domain [Aerococcus urinaeequi]|uniref:Coenzyme F420 hydrogenase/dehydrogenase, beta subunit C-terminal domain n=1 Tax=Aerococcus urinaeequi TaxID=51665 RepID=UPI003D6B9493